MYELNSQVYQPTAAEVSVPERLAFLRKIYGLLTLSVLFGIGGAWMMLSSESNLMMAYQYRFGFILLEIVALVAVYLLRHHPTWGLVSLLSFTTLTGIVSAPYVALYAPQAVAQAAWMTVGIFVGLSFYTITSKRDFSFMGGFLMAGLIALILAIILNIFFASGAMATLIALGGALLFSGFIVYDTFDILHRYPTEEFIPATLALYLDILNLFLMLLRLVGGGDD